MVAAGIADEVLIQVSYAIGIAKPIGIYVNTNNTSKVKMTDGQIAEKISKIFDMRPSAIVKRFGLKNPIFRETAAYGHMGRPFRKDKILCYQNGETDNRPVMREVEFFAWEKLDYVDILKKEFGI